MLFSYNDGSNPDQSKHLETARMRLFDVWIDFVNLRAEDYSENSRIPTMVLILYYRKITQMVYDVLSNRFIGIFVKYFAEVWHC